MEHDDVTILVSINCTTYNHEDYIADAIEGFLMQKTNFNYEILIGEDCSTDNTRMLIETYVKKHPGKIRLITSDKNVGSRKNSRRLLENSTGKYIAECEGDDYWIDPWKLQKQVDYLEGHPECALCFHATEVVQVSKKPTGEKIKPYSINRISPIEDIISGGGGFCHTGSLVYPRKLMKDPPDFFTTAHVGDYPMQLILASLGSVYYIGDCMSAYRIGVKGSWTSRMNSGVNIKEKMININDGDIKILEAFNNFTNFKYSKVVEKNILEKEFGVLLLQGKAKEQKGLRYKTYVDSLSVKAKLKILIQCHFPKIYGKLAGIKVFVFKKRQFN